MALRFEINKNRQALVQQFKVSQTDLPRRDKPSPKIRIKSETRLNNKMPIINSFQKNSSIELLKNFPSPHGKSPLRKAAPPKAEERLVSEEVAESSLLRVNKQQLAIDVHLEPKSFLHNPAFESKATHSPYGLENSLQFMHPKSMKQSVSTNLFPPAFTTKGHHSTLIPKIPRTRNLSNPKPSRTGLNMESLGVGDFSGMPQLQHLNLNGLSNAFIPQLEPSKRSTKKNGVVKSYAANTNQGIVRNYNEDRVAIILNMTRPAGIDYQGEWPACSLFGIYDGHGGTECADFLRDNLHNLVLRDDNFPFNPAEALRSGFQEAERQFTEWAKQQPYDINRSGSCAIVALIVDQTCYIANVGDSRAVMSCDQGKRIVELSRDHKPDDEQERERIEAYGGKVYQTQISQPLKSFMFKSGTAKPIFGPHRVFPGRLSVSRTFGDIEAKITEYGGIPGVVIADPEIKILKLTQENDFIILACDGVFDKLSNEDVVQCIWGSTKFKCDDLHQQSSIGVEDLLKESMLKKSMDNVTAIMIGLSGFHHALFPNEPPSPMAKVSNTKPNPEMNQTRQRMSELARVKASTSHTSLKAAFGFNPPKGGEADKAKTPLLEKSSPLKLINPNPMSLSDLMKKHEAQKTNDYQLGSPA